MRFLQQVGDKMAVLRPALSIAHQRGTALRVLALLDERETREVLPEVLDLASHVNRDLYAAREVIRRMDREFLRSQLPPLIDRSLEHATDEEYRRFAELLRDLDDRSALDSLVRRARQSSDPEIREVADDFMTKR